MDIDEANTILHRLGATCVVPREMFDRLASKLLKDPEFAASTFMEVRVNEDGERFIGFTSSGTIGVDGEMIPYMKVLRGES